MVKHPGQTIYRHLIKKIDPHVPPKFRSLWEHPAGPKTVFFWAPTTKWGLVLATVGDFFRPVDKLSTSQTAVLAATACIWTRYSMVIIPKNYVLFSVNFFLAVAQSIQIMRIWRYSRAMKKAGGSQ